MKISLNILLHMLMLDSQKLFINYNILIILTKKYKFRFNLLKNRILN